MKKTEKIKEAIKDLKEKIITKEDLNLTLEQINLIEDLLFKDVTTPLLKKCEQKINEDLKIIIKIWEEEKIIAHSPDEQFSFFETLKKELNHFFLVKLEIAFEPSRDFLERVKDWLKENLNQEIILEVKKNPQIVGGLIIEYQGKYLDLSLAKKIDEIIEQKIL